MKAKAIGSNAEVGYADELFGFPPIPPELRQAASFPVLTEPSQYVCDTDEGYVFRKEHVRVAQFWAWGSEKNILLHGDTGTGKTSFIEQFSARLNWPLFPLSCHEDMEISELIGSPFFRADGSTGFKDGPLIQAMKVGGILLMDEMNMLRNEVAGGLNRILESKMYLNATTGEMVVAHRNFRIAATGNAMDGDGKTIYKGVKAQNPALLARFKLGIRVDYMNVDDETLMLTGKAKGIHQKVANYLAEIADMSRKSFASGVLASPLSPRETIATAERMVDFSGNLTGDDAFQAQCKYACECIEMTFLFRWKKLDRKEFVTASNSVATRLGVPITLK